MIYIALLLSYNSSESEAMNFIIIYWSDWVSETEEWMYVCVHWIWFVSQTYKFQVSAMLQILIQCMLFALLSPPTTVAKQQTIELFDTAVCKLVPDFSLCHRNQCRIFSLLYRLMTS